MFSVSMLKQNTFATFVYTFVVVPDTSMLAFIRALQTHFGLPPMEVDLEEGIQANAALFRPEDPD